MSNPNTLHQLTEHVYWYTPDGRTDRPALAAVVGQGGSLMLDIGASVKHTAGFLQAIAAENVQPLRYAALTHWHWDHSFGAAALNVPLIAHEETGRQLAIQASYDWSDSALDQRVEMGQELAFCRDMLKLEIPDRSDFKLRPPDMLFSERLTVDLENVHCQMIHVGGDHAADSIVMFIPQDKVLFMGDALYDAIYAPQRHYTLAKTRALLAHITSLEVEHYILGHHTEVLSKEEMHTWLHNLRTIGDLIERFGQQRAAIVSEFQTIMQREPDEDDLADIDAFIAGI